ncbi:hypothetical protein ACFQAT_04885 [Undibacterium arcticum]|uniref:hypothetical protein n=1 Tax=Undibacterium arcticum TaxID=1762892 RepID=UPI003617554C
MSDDDDELAGLLLRHLFPAHIDAKTLLRHLHTPKAPNLLGSYVWFWTHEILQCAPEHLPLLLDGLVDRPEFCFDDHYERRLNTMADTLLARGVTIHGDQITDDRLFAWLGIGIDQHGHMIREKTQQQTIAGWLEVRPARYKAILKLCFAQCERHENPAVYLYVAEARLHHAAVPDDIGLWHLWQVSLTVNEALAQIHLSKAVNTLMYQQGATGLSLDIIDAWGVANPGRQQWLADLLVCEIPDWRSKQASRATARKQQYDETRRQRTTGIRPYLPAVRVGNASVGLMEQLANVWMNHFIDSPGETIAERFDNFCENGNEVHAAADAGLRLCPERADLPTVDEIVDLSVKQMQHRFRLPCLLGMDLRWQDGGINVDHLPEENLRRLVAFRLTYGVDKTPAWFMYLVQQRPALVADVLSAYASASLNAGQDFVDSIYPLSRDPEYRAVATIVAPRLLESFPKSARAGQLNHLECLLKAALSYTPENPRILAKKKIATKGMDEAQKVYWHAAATLLDPANNEAALWRYVGNRRVASITFLFSLVDVLPIAIMTMRFRPTHLAS